MLFVSMNIRRIRFNLRRKFDSIWNLKETSKIYKWDSIGNKSEYYKMYNRL